MSERRRGGSGGGGGGGGGGGANLAGGFGGADRGEGRAAELSSLDKTQRQMTSRREVTITSPPVTRLARQAVSLSVHCTEQA